MTRGQVEAVLRLCRFNDWQFVVGGEGNRLYLQVRCDGKCNVTGKDMPWSSRKWWLSAHMTKSEIVQTAFKAVLTAVEHEAREQFLYCGQSIFDPHYDVDLLWELRTRPDALSVRAA